MIHTLRKLIGLFCVSVLLLASGASAEPYNKVPDRVERKAQLLVNALKTQGFEVSRGYFKLWTINDCDYTAKIMGVCYGNNPAAPYVIATLPTWPQEFVDPVVGNLWGPSHSGYHDIYRFDPREAIIILGLLPPPASYFSEQTWLFTREGTIRTDSQTYKDINKYLSPLSSVLFSFAPNSNNKRIQVLSSLNNIINNVVIERQSGAAFNQVRSFIITPDQFMDHAVRNALRGIMVRDEDVFTEQIPSDMKVGLDQSSDDFTTWIRYAHPRDGGRLGTPSDRWRNELPMVVLRVRDTSLNRLPQKYPPVMLEERSAVDELRLKPDLENLLFAVSRRWGQPCVNPDCSDRAGTFIDMQTFPAHLVGPLCTAIGENCLLDTQDTIYQIYGPLPLDSGEIYAVAGTLGTETGNATYVGFGLNQMPMLKGVANLSHEVLRSTAKAYTREVNDTHKFYVYYFTRDCSGLNDFTDGNCFSLTEDLMPKDDQLIISIRDYIKPGTQRGPDSSKVLPAMIIQLR